VQGTAQTGPRSVAGRSARERRDVLENSWGRACYLHAAPGGPGAVWSAPTMRSGSSAKMRFAPCSVYISSCAAATGSAPSPH